MMAKVSRRSEGAREARNSRSPRGQSSGAGWRRKKKVVEERAGSSTSADSLEGVTVEAVAGHLAGFGYYFSQFNAGQRKAPVEAVVQAVTVEGPTWA
jgi:hypothetical protein